MTGRSYPKQLTHTAAREGAEPKSLQLHDVVVFSVVLWKSAVE
jgi:hypothetical protein